MWLARYAAAATTTTAVDAIVFSGGGGGNGVVVGYSPLLPMCAKRLHGVVGESGAVGYHLAAAMQSQSEPCELGGELESRSRAVLSDPMGHDRPHLSLDHG